MYLKSSFKSSTAKPLITIYQMVDVLNVLDFFTYWGEG
jgi:hypothetical protein